MKDTLSTLYDRFDAGREPAQIDLGTTADGDAVIAVGLSKRTATFLPLAEGQRVTGNAEAVQRQTLLVEIHKDERTGVTDPVVYDRVGCLRFITGMNVTHESDHGETINAEYLIATPGHVRESQHNHQHLVSDPENEFEYFAFGPF